MEPSRELVWLRRVRDLSQRLASEPPGRLLGLILDSAVEIAEAERGYLALLREKPLGGVVLKVVEARGQGGAEFDPDEAAISRTVVERVLQREERGLVTTSADDQDVLDASSVRERRVVSILCVPMRLRGETRGVIYLDHRVERGVFSSEDLACLRTFADQAALALESAELHGVEQALPPAERAVWGGLVGGSPAMLAVYQEVERASRSWDPVLVLGEAGVGKRAVAREVHARSPRAREPLLELSAAGGETVAEALLGARRGHAGAGSDRPGHLVLAGQGTLVLSEVEGLAPSLQTELLRVLAEQQVLPLGAHRPVPVACRVIATGSSDLRARVEQGAFRTDLYYRLDVQRVIVPPLRQRPEDVPALVDHFARAAGRQGLALSDKAARLLAAWAWPGNVRELENEVRRLVAQGVSRVGGNHLSPEIQEGRGLARPGEGFAGMTLGEVEREVVRRALEACQGNRAQAARQLGVPRSTLYHLLERHGLS